MYVNANRMLKKEKIRKGIEEKKKVIFDNAFAYLKGSQLKVSERLVKIALESTDQIAVTAAKEILKDVLVEKKEIITTQKVRTKEEILKELSGLLNAHSLLYIERERTDRAGPVAQDHGSRVITEEQVSGDSDERPIQLGEQVSSGNGETGDTPLGSEPGNRDMSSPEPDKKILENSSPEISLENSTEKT